MRRYPKDWRTISVNVLADEPMCRECAGYGISRRAKAVDHIISLSQGGTNDRSNLQPLCWRHHSKKTVRDGKAERLKWLPSIEAMERDALLVQLETMWTRNERGLLLLENDGGTTPAPFVAVAVTNTGERIVELGSTLTDDQAATAIAILEKNDGEPSPEEASTLIAAIGRVESNTRISAGPTYTFLPTLPEIHLGDGVRRVWCEDDDAQAHVDALSPAMREHLFPTWAAIAVDGKIVSMCNTVRLGTLGAEAGVNTVPEYRGRGFAAAAAAVWATNQRPTGRSLFYSTSHDNVSSQRVAQRLQLKRLGTLWSLRAATP